MDKTRSRWRVLEQLDEWITTPMLLLSLAWLSIVIVELTGESNRLLTILGTAIWIIFIAEFGVRYALAPEKTRFLRRNWLTLLSLLLPALRLFRALAMLRAAGALRGIRLVRIVGTVNRSMNALRASLSRRGFIYVLGLTVAVVALGAAGMLSFENSRDVPGGLTDYGHALWWTGMLVASLGTDYWPSTLEGRMLSALLAIYGLAVFGYITATFASFFIGRDADSTDGELAGAAELRALRRELALVRKEIAQLAPRERDSS